MAATADDIVTFLGTLSQKSVTTQEVAKTLTQLNMPLASVGQGPLPTVITQLNDMCSTASEKIQQLTATKPFPNKADQDKILSAYTTFAKVHQDLHNVLIGKASGGLLDSMPFVGAPVSAVLRQLEAVVDTLEYMLLDLCPQVSEAMTKQIEGLDPAMAKSIQAWAGWRG